MIWHMYINPILVRLLVGHSIVEGMGKRGGVKNTHPNRCWHDYKLTHMIKTELNIFMITSLFCFCQHFSVMTSLIFLQSFGHDSFSVTTEPLIV